MSITHSHSPAFDSTLRIWDIGDNVERALAHLPDQVCRPLPVYQLPQVV